MNVHFPSARTNDRIFVSDEIIIDDWSLHRFLQHKIVVGGDFNVGLDTTNSNTFISITSFVGVMHSLTHILKYRYLLTRQ